MAIDLKQTFNVDPQNIERILAQPNWGYYIPSYQRPYAWKRNNIQQLLTNVCEGLTGLLQMDDTITFLGTLIFIHDTKYTSVEPAFKNDLPGAVYLVIDGQQRLSTFLLLAVALHEIIGRRSAEIASTSPAADWINQQKTELCSRLENIIMFDTFYGEGHWRWYPRIIRAYEDQWGRTKQYARYNSPMASLLAQYLRYLKDPSVSKESPFVFDIDAVTSQDSKKQELTTVATNYSYLVDSLKRLAEGKAPSNDEDDARFPEFTKIVADKFLQSRFFQYELSSDIIEILLEADPGKREKRVQEIARIFAFTRYMLERVATTTVKVAKEEYAFDMFEALNTTGEPLTAYETFKPKVINREGLEKFEDSPSGKALRRVDEYLDHERDREQASQRLLIPFALYWEGEKLGKQLRAQRNYLRRSYEKQNSMDKQREFVKEMAVIARFLKECWPEDRSLTESDTLGGVLLGQDRAVVLLCMEALRSARHTIPIASLARFHAMALDAPNEKRATAGAEFAAAVKAITAFFVLWRASRTGTDNLDKIHRDLLIKGMEDAAVNPLNYGAGFQPDAAALKRYFRKKLEGDGKTPKIHEMTLWRDRAADVPIYKQGRELTKLLLMAASLDAIPDSIRPGFTANGKTGIVQSMTLSFWNEYPEVEHVAPEKGEKNAAWSDEIYQKDAQHFIGNLTLLPRSPNASMQDKSWLIKRCYYLLLSSEEADQSQIISDLGKLGITFQQSTLDMLGRAKHHPHIRSIATLPSNHSWDLVFIRNRTEHLLERAWKVLYTWLAE